MITSINKYFHSSLIKTSGTYTLTSILNSAIPFFLLPILTRYLTTEDYGIVAMFSVLISIVGVFTGLSVHGAIQREYYNQEEINFKEYVANCLLILFVSSSLVFLIMTVFSNEISKVSGVPAHYLWLVVLISFFQFLILSLLSIYQAQMKALQYSGFQISQTLLNVFFSILFVVYLSMNWRGRIYGQFIAVTIIGFISLFILVNYWTVYKFNYGYVKKALQFGVPLIPHSLGGMVMLATDRFMISNMLDLSKTGIYTVGFQIGMIIEIVAASFNRAYVPWLYDKLKKDEWKTKIKIVRLTYLYFILILIFALGLGLFSPYFLKFLVGKHFQGSQEVIIWIALGCTFHGMYYMVVNYIFYIYKTQILAWITFSSAILNIPLTYYLIKIYGIKGAALSYCIIFALMFLSVWVYSIKSYPMPWFNFLRLSTRDDTKTECKVF